MPLADVKDMHIAEMSISRPRLEAVMLGTSTAMEIVRAQIESAAATDAPVLITGESGTGKGLAAATLHNLSSRSRHSLVKVNCPAIPTQLFESELFGYEAGAFTGAKVAKPGKFEAANCGTLFLDEIGELDIAMQAKLLRVLQDFRVVRLGSVEERPIDIRLICGTNRSLERAVQEGTFRADLFYRINVLNIEMPPLRVRTGDIPMMLEHFIKIYSDQFGRKPKPISSSALQILETYHWPGNLRELENMTKRFVVLGGEEHMLTALRPSRENDMFFIPAADVNTPLRIQTKRAIQAMERRIIFDVLRAHKWNRRSTARSLDISYRALLYKIKEAGLPSLRPNYGKKINGECNNQEGICR